MCIETDDVECCLWCWGWQDCLIVVDDGQTHKHAIPCTINTHLQAVAVVRMLERRAGEDVFRKAVQMTFAAASGLASGVGPDGDVPVGLGLGTLDAVAFVTELGRLAGFRKDVPAFLARWVYHAGAPRITAGYVYHAGAQRRSVLELALRQEGCEEAALAAAAAARAAESAGAAAGILRVSVQESEALVEHPVHLGDEPWKLAELKVNPEVKRVPGRRGPKRQKVVDEDDKNSKEDPLFPFARSLEAGKESVACFCFLRDHSSCTWDLSLVGCQQPDKRTTNLTYISHRGGVHPIAPCPVRAH